MSVKDEHVAAMLLGRRAIRVVPLPGFVPVGDEPVPTIGVRILTEGDLDAARVDAIQYAELLARKRNIETRRMLELDAEILDRELQRAIVFRAFVEPTEAPLKPGEEPKTFFDSITRIRQHVDSVLLKAFFEVYCEHQEFVSPYRSMNDDEAKELADTLSKEPNVGAFLALYDAPSLRRLVLTLVRQCAT